MHRPREVAVSAERHHERDAIADRFAAGCDDRKPAGKTDPDNADLAVGAKLRLPARPEHCVLDRVGDLWRDLEALKIRRRDGQDAVTGSGEILRQADETRFVDAIAMHAGNQQQRPPRLAGRTVEAARNGATARRHGDLGIARECVGTPLRDGRRCSGKIRSPDDEAEGV